MVQEMGEELKKLTLELGEANAKADELMVQVEEEQKLRMQALTQSPKTRRELELAAELQRLTARLAVANATQVSEKQILTTVLEGESAKGKFERLTRALKEANTKAAALTKIIDEEHHFTTTFEKWKRTDWTSWQGFLDYPGRMEPFQFFPDIASMQKEIGIHEAFAELIKTSFPEGMFPPHQSPPP
jgi:hypothetical protein